MVLLGFAEYCGVSQGFCKGFARVLRGFAGACAALCRVVWGVQGLLRACMGCTVFLVICLGSWFLVTFEAIFCSNNI